MKKTLLFCAIALIVSCKSERDKMIDKVEATDKLLMADTLMLNDSLRAQQYNTLSEFALKFPKDEKTPTYLLKSADLANTMRRTMQAFMTYKKVSDSFPDTREGADATFMMAFLYETSFGNTEKAKEYYTILINKYPNHPFAKDARITLDQLNAGKTPEDIVREAEARENADSTVRK